MALLASRKALWLLAALTLAFGLAALPALGTISDRGAGILDFEPGKFALSVPAVLYALGCWLATAVARPG